MQPTTAVYDVRKLLARIRLWHALILLIMVVFTVRLFYLQIIQHDFYKKAALLGQLKEYEIKPTRGVISAHDGDNILPIVLNDTRYTLFADPKFITNRWDDAENIQKIIGGNVQDYERKLKVDSRYSILAKKLNTEQKDKLDALKIKGIGTREESYRTYPQGDLAAQLLGFVNDEGDGKYGVEQKVDSTLRGTSGQLRAITDAQGVPLLSDSNNVIKQPKNGKSVTLTIDVSMQRQLQDVLKAGLDTAKSKSGSALIIDPTTGAVKAMANYPTYNPAEFYKVEDANVFNNANVSAPLEVGSSMKVLTAAAALDQGVVNANTTYYDPSRFKIGDATVTNIEEDGGPGTRSIADILQLSLNTGATWLLMQMGGGEINQKARVAWNDYLVNHYQFNKQTGIEQGYEASGYVPSPTDGFGLNIQYANMAFGQGLNITTLQLAAALSSVINGGTYYKPYLIDATIDDNGNKNTQTPTVVRQNVIKPDVSKTMQALMENVMNKNHVMYGMPVLPAGYNVGGKTGTAEVTKPGGGYYDDRFNGTFIGYVGGNQPEYVIIVRVNEPKIGGYAGAKAAAPIFSNLTNMLIKNFGVTPKTQ